MIAPDNPTLVYGARGIVCLEVTLTGPAADLHSGLFGGLIANPANTLVRLGGTLPILQALNDSLGIDTLLVGLEWMDCRIHSPNENFPIKNLARGVEMNRQLLTELAAL